MCQSGEQITSLELVCHFLLCHSLLRNGELGVFATNLVSSLLGVSVSCRRDTRIGQALPRLEQILRLCEGDMAILRVSFLGDVACLEIQAPAESNSNRNYTDTRENRHEENEAGCIGDSSLDFILGKSFGKLIEVGS